MVLSDADIAALLKSGGLVIDPMPPSCRIQPASIDLTLGNEFRKLERARAVDPFRDYDYTQPLPLRSDGTVVIPAFTLVLATTREYVEIPNYLVGRVDGKSSLGRLGIFIHATAGNIDPGFQGHITLEVMTAVDTILTPGMDICHLQLTRLTSLALKPYGTNGNHYQGQVGPTPSRYYQGRTRVKAS